jgi:hypothetical protein
MADSVEANCLQISKCSCSAPWAFPVITIDTVQFNSLAQSLRQRFLLEALCNWMALQEAFYNRPPKLDFGRAWEAADHLMNQVDMLPHLSNGNLVHALVHGVLSAAEKGATAHQLRQGVAAYLEALPCHEAGLILLDVICTAERVADER